MILNYIWIGFFAVAGVTAGVRLLMWSDVTVFPAMMEEMFAAAQQAFTIAIGLTGVLSLWLGFMKIAESGGVVRALARILSPLFSRLFPAIPKGDPVMGTIFMNIAANMLGLDNAATPMGLKAMEQLQELNAHKSVASNPMIMFLVLNTSGLTLIPISIMVYRTQLGAAQPTDVFIPILLTTFCSTLAGIVAVAVYQRINLLNRVVLSTLGGVSLLMAAILWACHVVDKSTMNTLSTLVANILLFLLVMGFIVAGLRKKVNVYDAFIEGAKDGFGTAVRIIPYLAAMLVGVAVFRASGAMELLTQALGEMVSALGLNADFVGALPTALMKPLSGSGARGLMVDAMNAYGADSFVGRLACMFQGSTDTTFYVLALYFGSVGIRHTRHAVACGLIADVTGIVAAIAIGYLFF